MITSKAYILQKAGGSTPALGYTNDVCLIKGKGGHQFYQDDTWLVMKELLQRL